MRDYSKYFKNPESFITNINTTKDKIIVTFSSGTEWTYDLTKENITRLYQILSTQYQEVIANANKVTSNNLTPIFGCLLVFCGILLFGSFDTHIYEAIMPLSCLSLVGVVGSITNEGIKNYHRRTIAKYKNIISSLSILKEAVPVEENILKPLSNSAHSALNTEQELESSNLVDNMFNINWIDHMSKSDLIKLQEQIKIYQGLNDTVEIISTKTKKRVPNSEK